MVSKPTAFPGTFVLEPIRNAKVHALDGSFFGLPTSSVWALRARSVNTPLVDLKANETLVVLEIIDLTNNASDWVSIVESRFHLSATEVTSFVFSPTKETLALSVQNLRA